MSHNWMEMNERLLKALGLEGQPVISIEIKFSAYEMPVVEVMLDLPSDDCIITELSRYELVEKKPSDQGSS